MFRVVLVLGASLSFAQGILPKSMPISKTNPPSKAKIELGKALYFDPRISESGTVSCQSCHNVMAAGDDNRAVSVGVAGKTGGRSAPTVFNAGFYSAQFWDGRAASLEQQALGPLTNPVEMAMASHSVVINRIESIPGYVADFKKAFPNEQTPTIEQLGKAIASFERTLVAGNSTYDRCLSGEKKACNPQAMKGLATAQEVGCLGCHSGPHFSGPTLPEGVGFYQKFPVFADHPEVKKYAFTTDSGRFEVTKDPQDRHLWRVPSWRNVSLTAPYFHNGSVKDLSEAIRVMAKTQLNRDLSDEQVTDIHAFLVSLNGEFPKIEMPRLPLTIGMSVIETKMQ